jgi:hypothetical protein
MVYAIPLNRFMISMAFIRTILPYLHKVDINDFILHKFMSEKDREAIQDHIVLVLRGNGLSNFEIQTIMARMSLDLKEQTAIFSQADLQIFKEQQGSTPVPVLFSTVLHYRVCRKYYQRQI